MSSPSITMSPLLGDIGFGFRDRPLDQHGALERVDDAAELHQQAVAGGLDEAAAVLMQDRIDQLAAMRPLAGNGRGLVGLHVARIADHVDRQDGGEPACHAVAGQNCAPLAHVPEKWEPVFRIDHAHNQTPEGTAINPIGVHSRRRR
jgi:hypothetical protein